MPRKKTMPRHDDSIAHDPANTPMTGTFPTVTVADEIRLRAAGYLPVLRWVRVLATGGLSTKAVKAEEALGAVERAARGKAGQRGWAARRGKRGGR